MVNTLGEHLMNAQKKLVVLGAVVGSHWVKGILINDVTPRGGEIIWHYETLGHTP